MKYVLMITVIILAPFLVDLIYQSEIASSWSTAYIIGFFAGTIVKFIEQIVEW